MKKLFILLLFIIIGIGIISCNSNEIIEENIEITIEDGVIGGKLLTSHNDTIIIVVPGSGPTDMNGAADSYKLLAKELAKNKFDVFRYDKRGLGKSKNIKVVEKDVQVEDYIGDIKNIIKHFKNTNSYKKIAIIGHSQGALFSSIAIENEYVDYFISLSGAGFPIDEIIIKQIKNNKYNPDYIIKESEKILTSLKKGDKVKNINPLLNSLFRYDIQDYMISWIKYDPCKEIKKLEDIKVLIIQGDNDIQIDVNNADNLHNALKSSELKIVKDMNHILKIAPPKEDYKKHLDSYSDNSAPVSEELIKYIVDFINN